MSRYWCCPSRSSPAPESTWSWLVCFSGCLSYALVFGMLQCYAVVMPVLMAYFEESREKMAWAGSLAAGLIFLCMPLSTMVMTHLNIRYTAILGILMCITSLVVTSFTTNIIQLFFSYSILYGLGFFVSLFFLYLRHNQIFCQETSRCHWYPYWRNQYWSVVTWSSCPVADRLVWLQDDVQDHGWFVCTAITGCL